MSTLSQLIVISGLLAACGWLALRWRRASKAAATASSVAARVEPQWRHSQFQPDSQSGRI